jgi:hypothetical protein
VTNHPRDLGANESSRAAGTLLNGGHRSDLAKVGLRLTRDVDRVFSAVIRWTLCIRLKTVGPTRLDPQSVESINRGVRYVAD